MERIGRRHGSVTGGPEGADRGQRPAPGKRTLIDQIQRKADGTAAGVLPGDAFATATAGAASAVPHQARMEAAFGQSFAGVKAHVGTAEAQGGLSDLGARGAAFGEQVAFAEASPDPHLVAHELAHVVQARNSGGGVQTKRDATVSEPGDASEAAADRAADAVMRGEPVGDVGTASGVTLHRAVATNGGVFQESRVNVVNGSATSKRVGAGINIEFTPNDLVEAPASGIALIQTVRGNTNRVPSTSTLHTANDQNNTAISSDADERSLTSPSGAAVDITPHARSTDTNHNPIYGVGSTAPDTSTDLHGGTPTNGWGRRGSHERRPAGGFAPPVSARMEDGPRRNVDVDGQTFAMDFEVAALVTDGPLANTYLGSVGWGWSSNDAMVSTFSSPPISVLSAGAPTATFMDAAKTWNDAQFHQGTTAVDTINLPTTTVSTGTTAASGLGTSALIARLRTVTAELDAHTLTGADVNQRQFERTALEAELRRRRFEVVLTCHRISDAGGAVRPRKDEVSLALDTASGATPTSPVQTTLTGTRNYHAGDSHTYTFPITNFFPMNAPVHIEVNEHDRAGGGSAAQDAKLFTIDWDAPFAAVTQNTTSGTYTIQVRLVG